eukprot:scaffold308828_cov36-Prasinocladus_malaysianus.AAC.1
MTTDKQGHPHRVRPPHVHQSRDGQKNNYEYEYKRDRFAETSARTALYRAIEDAGRPRSMPGNDIDMCSYGRESVL